MKYDLTLSMLSEHLLCIAVQIFSKMLYVAIPGICDISRQDGKPLMVYALNT